MAGGEDGGVWVVRRESREEVRHLEGMGGGKLHGRSATVSCSYSRGSERQKPGTFVGCISAGFRYADDAEKIKKSLWPKTQCSVRADTGAWSQAQPDCCAGAPQKETPTLQRTKEAGLERQRGCGMCGMEDGEGGERERETPNPQPVLMK